MAGEGAEERIAGKAVEGVIAKAVGSLVRDAEDVTDRAGARVAADTVDTAAKRAAADDPLAAAVGSTFDNAHPGPLSPKLADTFTDGRYEVGVTGEHAVYYRGGDKYATRGDPALGQFYTDYPPASVSELRRDLAVKEEWTDEEGNVTGRSPINTGYAIEMPPGTYYFKGETASQGGPYVGGATQYVFPEPWNYDPPPRKVAEWPLDP